MNCSCTLNVVYRLKNLRPMALSILPPLRGFLHQNCDNRSNIKNNRDNINKDPKDIGQKQSAIITPTLTKASGNSNRKELNSRINITQKNKMNIGPGTSANVANSSPISGKPWCAAFEFIPLRSVFHDLPMAKVYLTVSVHFLCVLLCF